MLTKFPHGRQSKRVDQSFALELKVLTSLLNRNPSGKGERSKNRRVLYLLTLIMHRPSLQVDYLTRSILGNWYKSYYIIHLLNTHSD